MPPPSVKLVHDVPMKHLYDTSKLIFKGDVAKPDMRFVLAFPTDEPKSKFNEPKKYPTVHSSVIEGVKDIAKTRHYDASPGKILMLPGEAHLSLLIGGGKLDSDGKVSSRATLRKMADCVANYLREQRPSRVSFEFPEVSEESFPYFLAYLKFASYNEDRFRMVRSKVDPLNAELGFPHQKASLNDCLKTADVIAESLLVMREVADAPPNYCHPTSLKKVGEDLAKKYNLEFKAFNFEACQKMGMGGFCGVSQGMTNEPWFLHLKYKNGCPKHRFSFIGKGVCMDTGGYALKPLASMYEMHHDMGGAAVTLALVNLIGSMKPDNVEIDFIIPCVENLVDAQAYLNGDVITTMSGLNVIIRNTDAEGRMILCDGITYAQKMMEDVPENVPKTIVTTATLTGAAIMALGKKMAPFYSTSDSAAKLVDASSEINVDKVWRLPFASAMDLMNEDDRADMPNISKTQTGGGSIVAAMFLKNFVTDDSVDYLHFDIAGPMTNSKSQTDAFGPLLLYDFLTKTMTHK